MKTEYALFNYIGEIELPSEVIDDCPKSGACDSYIDYVLNNNEYVSNELEKINPDKLKIELSEYGAWDDDELSNHYNNLERILWIAIFNIYEEG